MITIPRELEPLIPCRNGDPEDWFPLTVGRYDSAAYAERLCSGCPLLAECRDYALTMRPPPDGIWGGTTRKQRDAIRRRKHPVQAGAL